MRKWLIGGLVLFVFLLFHTGVRAYTWNYSNVSFDFNLDGFSNTSSNSPTPTNGPIQLTISNITGLTLPNPPAGTYDWYLTIDNFSLDFAPNATWDDVYVSNLGPFYVGTWQAPLASTGSVSDDVTIPSYTFTLQGYTFTVGGYTVNNATLSWELYNSGVLAQPGDPITKIILTLTGDNLDTTISADLTALDNTLGGANGYIDGTGSASFKLSAVPEPSTVLLVGAGGLLVMGLARRRRE